MSPDVLQLFCRHLIGIGWYEGRVNENDEFTKTPDFYGASGFLLQLHEELPSFCALITAGHVFTDYQERMSKPRMGAKVHSIFDSWGPYSRCKTRIPFDLFGAPAFVTYDEKTGVDLAAVPLPELVLTLLLQTTIPFRKANWVHQRDISFAFFAMLGLPNEDAEQITKHADVKSINTLQNPALLFLDPCELPDGIAPASNPQFVGRIKPCADLKSVVGMSGGPIFGFCKNSNGPLAYWPVAIQSRWLPERRIVIGTLLAPIALTIEQDLEKFLRQDST